MNKTLAALTLASSLALVGAGPAMASTYPAPAPSALVSDGTVSPGESFTFSASGFVAGEQVTIILRMGGSITARFTTTADADGKVTFPLTITEAGRYTIEAIGSLSGRTASSSVEVANPIGAAPVAAVPDTGLASTGADAGLVLWALVGAGALAAGGATVIRTRRRAKPIHQ